MRKYSLVDTENKRSVNLLDYETLIIDTIQSVCPDMRVKVEKDGYCLPDEVSRGNLIRIGKALARTKLGRYCINRPLLFRGETVKKCSKENKVKENIRNGRR